MTANNNKTGTQPGLAIVLKGYPRLSETFIAQEIEALEKRGADILIVSLRHPYDPKTHPVHDRIKANILYLPEYLHDEPLRVIKALLHCLFLPGFWALMGLWLKDFRRDMTLNRLRRLGQALVLVRELPASVRHLYTHFMHTPGSVARYASKLLDMSYSLSAHAKDIWTLDEWEKREKLEDCAFLVTCTRSNTDHLRGIAPNANIDLVYHGLDLAGFPAADAAKTLAVNSTADASPDKPVRIMSVGRAVAKKGYDDLLTALARLPKDLHWHFTHIGGGALTKDLKQQADQLGLGDKITWRGACSREEVFEEYRQSDLFVLASKIAEDGDRDGLPNVLMEAQAHGLCCLATEVSAIPELIIHNSSGVLVQPGNASDLQQGLERLLPNPALRQELAAAGVARIHEAFSVDAGIDFLWQKLAKTGGVASR